MYIVQYQAVGPVQQHGSSEVHIVLLKLMRFEDENVDGGDQERMKSICISGRGSQ